MTLPTVVTCFNTKGGSGKTTLASALAVCLARTVPTLAIDLDRQGQLTTALGRLRDDGLANWLSLVSPAPIEKVVTGAGATQPSVIASGYYTATLDAQFVAYTMVGGLPEPVDDLFLRRRIDRDLQDFAFVVLDTAAAGYLAGMAVAAANVLVIPVSMRALDVDGTQTFAKMLAGGQLRQGTRVLLVPNRFDRRAPAMAAKHLAQIQDIAHTNGWTVTTPIHESADVDRAFAAGRVLADLHPTHVVALQFNSVAQDVLASRKEPI